MTSSVNEEFVVSWLTFTALELICDVEKTSAEFVVASIERGLEDVSLTERSVSSVASILLGSTVVSSAIHKMFGIQKSKLSHLYSECNFNFYISPAIFISQNKSKYASLQLFCVSELFTCWILSVVMFPSGNFCQMR